MITLAVIYLVIYSAQVVTEASGSKIHWLDFLSTGIWIIFLADLILRILGSPNYSTFLRSNWLEILALLLPFLRALRILRVFVALRGIKLLSRSRAEKAGIYMMILIPFTWFTGAIAVLDAEANSIDSRIDSLGSAAWWSLATITTVGYGDIYPVTTEGKMVAALLMIAGISLFSAGAGIFASWVMGEKK
jgi:voltage-gated potassium channel